MGVGIGGERVKRRDEGVSVGYEMEGGVGGGGGSFGRSGGSTTSYGQLFCSLNTNHS